MISFVRGQLVSKQADSPRGPHFIVDLNGLGFDVASSVRSVECAPEVGQEVTLFTSLIVREDAMNLVGFSSREERDLFNILTSAQGVGAKVALALLSTLSVSEIAQAVVSGDHKTLSVAKGVGPKLAQKIALDLKEKMTQWRKSDLSGVTFTGSVSPAFDPSDSKAKEAYLEAESVMLSLGYSMQEIRQSFAEIALEKTSPDSETILRQALGWLAQAV